VQFTAQRLRTLGTRGKGCAANAYSARRKFPALVDAFALVKRDHPASRLVILGEGPERAAIEAPGRHHATNLQSPRNLGRGRVLPGHHACFDGQVVAFTGFQDSVAA
jgi:hypothetical protein